jgi:hypothetical protein
VKEFMPWALVGFTLNLLTGAIFVVSEPAQYFGNPTWWLKVTFLIIAGLNAFIFETAYGSRAAALPAGEDTPTPLQIIAAVSLISWAGVLWAGRMLPFLGRRRRRRTLGLHSSVADRIVTRSRCSNRGLYDQRRDAPWPTRRAW